MKILRKLLYPHPAVLLLLILLTGMGLGWIFSAGVQNSLAACCFYPLCAYSLGALCLRFFPWLAQRFRKQKEKQGRQARQQFHRSLIGAAAINLIYGLFQILVGILSHAPWVGSRGAYQLVTALIHLVLLRYEKKLAAAQDPQAAAWAGFRACGFWLLLLHLPVTALTFQTVWHEEANAYPGFLIFAVAAYTFYKLTLAILRVTQHRKTANPIWGAVRNLDLSEATTNLFFLQAALLHTFSSPEQADFRFLMNSISGTAVCLMTVGGAAGMILHGTRKIQKFKGETLNGR